jgi:nucleoside-diphosphate-sugar epimerase
LATHLVTGGSGFVGGHTVRLLHQAGERVRVLDVIDSPDRPPACAFIQASVLDRKAVRDAVDGVDYVHHLAALVPLTKAGTHFREVNVEGTQVTADAALDAGVRLFIHTSSSAVYGAPGRCPVTENTPLCPLEDYGRAKLAAEGRVFQARARGLRCAVIRPRTVVGPGRLGIFQILFEWIREGRKLYVIGDGRNLFQFVHARDLVNASLQCIRADAPGVYNVGTDRFGTLRDDLCHVIRHARSNSRVVGLPVGFAMAALRAADTLRLSPLAPWHYLTYHKPFHFDLSHVTSALGWRPAYGNRDMLVEAYDWFLANAGDGGRPSGGSTHRSHVKQGLLRLAKWLS